MKLSTNIVLFLVLMNATAGFGDAAGIWDDWGVESPNPGISDQIEETQNAFETVTSGSLGAATLIGVFLTVLNVVKLGFGLVTTAPSAFTNIGLPGFIAILPNAIIMIIFGRGVLSAYSGREI